MFAYGMQESFIVFLLLQSIIEPVNRQIENCWY